MTEIWLFEVPHDDPAAMAALVRVCMSMHLGECCKYCGREYKTLDDLKDTVWAGEHAKGRLACKACWDASHTAPKRPEEPE
jgi:hypothetical protein